MTSIFTKILEYGEDPGKADLLQEIINSTDGDKLFAMIKSKLVDPQVSRALGYIFKTLSNSGNDEKKLITLIEGILKEAPKQRLTNQQNNSLVMRLVIEVDRLPTPHLVRLTAYCINQLQKEKPDSTSWKELLPKLLYLLQGKGSVTHDGSEMTGPEYKSQVIHTLCMTEWRSNIITMVADMFSEVPLSEEEMNQVTNKLYAGLAGLEPAEVPPLVHQLLRVCGDRCCLTLLMHVQEYFSSRLGGVSSETDNETDTISHATLVETKQSEGTVLFHILHCASLGRPTIRLMLKTLKSLSQAPELIFGGPLLLPSALLMIASLTPYQDTVLTLMTNAVGQAVLDDEQRRNSNWVRELVVSQRNLQSVLENIINETPVERGMVLEGLVSLCFELLRTKRQGKHERTAERMWSLGSSTLLYLVKKNRDALPTVVEKLVENFTKPSKYVTQFVRCFQQVVASKPLYVLKSQEFLSFFLVDQLMAVAGPVAEQAVLALVPMLHLCEPLCNSLVLVLRKSLNIPRVSTRQMAVTGLLVMMQKLKARRMGGTLSQQFDSPTSSSSQQISDIMVHGVNGNSVRNPEALCLELLHMLKHCFTFQAEVKLRLYQGMLELAVCNPEMSLPALQFLHTHLRRLRTEDADRKCPLRLDTLCKSSLEEDAAILTEPLAHLVFAVTQVLVRAGDEAENKPWFPQLEREIQDIAGRFSRCSLHDLGFEEDEHVLEEGEKGSRKQLLLGQTLGLYEALIAFAMQSWSRDKEQGETLSRRVTALFKIYSSISDYSKSLKRPASKKKDADNSQQAGPANPRKRGRPGAGATLTGFFAQRDTPKMPPVLDLGTLHLILQLLFNKDVEWAREEDAEHVRARLEFQCWALRAVPIVVQDLRNCSLSELMNRQTLAFQQLCEVAQVLYQHCVCVLSTLQDEYPDTALLALEAFRDTLAYTVNSHRDLLPHFLVHVIGGATAENWTPTIHRLTDQLTELLQEQLERAAGQEEQESFSKLHRLIISLISQTCDLLESDDKQLDKVQHLVQDISRKQSSTDEGVVKGVLDLLATINARRSNISHPLAVITRHLCHLIGLAEEEELSVQHKELKLVKEEHANAVTILVCTRLRETLDRLNLIIQRLKCERLMLPYIVNADRDILENEIKQKERGLCDAASKLVNVAVLLSSMAVDAELAEPILRAIIALYATLTSLSRHFTYFSTRSLPAFRGANFEKLVRTVGRSLAANVQTFVMHVEGKLRERYEQMETKKRFNAVAAQKRVIRESDCVARTIFGMETFSKTIIQLSAKTKIPIKDNLTLGVSHDFRINSHQVQKALADLKAQQQSDDEDGNNSGSESTGQASHADNAEEDEATNMDED